ncbi:MAG: LuxR C-terminal-related transcriptional regulator [Bacillota bacterium]
MGAPLLKAKLYVQPVQPGLVSRPRLTGRLASRSGRKLTLVSAPAGFGKTTLLREWVSRCNQPVAWVSLDGGDNDPVRFWSYVIAALQTVQAGLGESHLSILQSTPFAPGEFAATAPLPAEAFLTGLVNEVTDAESAVILVLDDYHLITDPRVHDGVIFLLDNLPPRMHLVVSTRSDPPWPLARWRARDELAELRQTDLRFNCQEAAEFLNETMGLGLSADDIAVLTSRTEGWIAGLQMAAVSMRGRDDASGFIKAFKGNNRYILDYLTEEVLQGQPESMQTFLLRTSILDRLTGPLCDAVTSSLSPSLRGEGSSQATLEMLERANMFVVPLDDERRWYRYHHLFADLLRRRLLEQVGEEGLAHLHRRASEWYESNGLVASAIGHALGAGDFGRAARLIEQVAEETLIRSEIATLLNWLEALPEDVVRARPLLCVYHAAVLFLHARPMEVIGARLEDAAKHDAVDLVSGTRATVQALIALFQGDAQRSTDLCQQALELLPEDRPFFRSVVANNLGVITYMMGGDLETASRCFEEAVRLGRQVGNSMMAVVALCQLAEICIAYGQLHKARAQYELALESAVDEKGQRLPVAAMPLMGLGELLREWNQLDAAVKHLTDGIELAKKWTEFSALDGYISLARVRHAQGDAEGARESMRTAERLAARFVPTKLDDFFVDAYQARLAIAQGDLRAAARWAQSRGLVADGSAGSLETGKGSSFVYHVHELELITLAKMYIAQGLLDKALGVLGPLLESAERLKRMGSVVQIRALLALALEAKGHTLQALGVLQQALSLAEPEGYMRVFLDEGPPMARMLHRAASRDIAPEYTGRLLAAFAQPEAPATSEREPRALIVEPLSERETEVLQLISRGLSNREIAQRLFVSLPTIKWHATNIYGKLGVRNRTQAVARARALGILTTA